MATKTLSDKTRVMTLRCSNSGCPICRRISTARSSRCLRRGAAPRSKARASHAMFPPPYTTPGRRRRSPGRRRGRIGVTPIWFFRGSPEYSGYMRRPGFLRRLVSLLVGTTLLLSLAAPARAQFDPVTMSLMMGALQLATGVAAAIGLGMAQDGNKQGIAMPNGVPCGLQDGVPQICWQPHNGGFEGSPDLPTGAKPFTRPPAAPAPTLELEVQPLDRTTTSTPAGQ